MQNIAKNNYPFLALFMLVLCLLVVSLSVWTIRGAELIHARQTYDEIYAIKKRFLADTVRNAIRDIDAIRATNVKRASEIRIRLIAELDRLEKDHPARFLEYAAGILAKREDPGAINLVLEDTATGGKLFEFPTTEKDAFPSSEEEYRYSSYRLRSSLNEAWIDDNTKASVAAMLHEKRYENGGYIWVNEVRNWAGGPDYAIRRIHPSLPDTEGELLSTETRDFAGNLPYLEELEGVRERGEVFYTYFFKLPDEDRFAKKLTYATLYKDYRWIVAMGFYLEDVQTYIDAVAATSRALTARIVAYSVAGFFLLFLSALFVLFRMERQYITKTSQMILEESNVDPLTGAFNRRMGDLYLADAFNKFRHGTETSALLLFDIDDFKLVNDRYGHKVGDRVLQAIVGSMKKNLRSSDNLIRWGGEEFLILCYGIRDDEARLVSEKLRDTIASMKVPIDPSRDHGEGIRVTLSFGAAWFLKEDEGPDAAFLRADVALYRAKAAGKNCVRVQEEG